MVTFRLICFVMVIGVGLVAAFRLLVFSLVVIGVGFGVLALLATGVCLVVRDTRRKSGRWGMNTAPAVCSQCRTPAPVFRKPASLNQMIWGGWTCRECGLELDQWGRPVAKQRYPAKWSVHLDEEPADAGPVDERYKPSKDEYQRGDFRG